MNRQELLEAYIDRILDNMSTKDLIRIAVLEDILFHHQFSSDAYQRRKEVEHLDS